MFVNDKSIDSIEELLRETEQYIRLQKEYIRVELVEKLVLFFSALTLTVVLIILGLMALFYFSFGLAQFLAAYVGGLAAGYALIGVGVLVLLGCIFLFRKQLVVRPLVRFMAKLLMSDSKQ